MLWPSKKKKEKGVNENQLLKTYTPTDNPLGVVNFFSVNFTYIFFLVLVAFLLVAFGYVFFCLVLCFRRGRRSTRSHCNVMGGFID